MAYRVSSHPIYPDYLTYQVENNRADFCDSTGQELERCPRCHSKEIYVDQAESNHSLKARREWSCNRCYTRYPSVQHVGHLNANRLREVLGVYKDFSGSLQGIKQHIKDKKNVIAFSTNAIDSVYLAVALLYHIGHGMILDDNANQANRLLISETYQELTGHDTYNKASYKFITNYADIRSHLRMDLSITPLIIRRNIQPLRRADLVEMEQSNGKLEWHPGIASLVSGGGVVVIHTLQAEDFKSPEAKTYLSSQLYHYSQNLQPKPKVYMPCYSNIMLK